MKQRQLHPYTSGSIDDVLPHSREAERAVIGALLLESTAINEVAGMLLPEHFYNSQYGRIYAAILALYDQGLAIDMLAVTNRLIQTGEITEIGGPAAISDLASVVTSAAHITSHAQYVHQLSLSRQLVQAGQTIAGQAMDRSNDVDDVIVNSLKQIEAVAAGACYNAQTVDISQAAREGLKMYFEREKLARSGRKAGIPTGLSKLDKFTSGWRPGQLIIFAARPAMGKTALMLHYAGAAAAAGVPVVIFSLEMAAASLVDRMLVSASNLPADRYRAGFLADADRPALCQAADNLAVLPITIDDTANISIQQIKARARNLQRKGRCGLILIDYLQLIDTRTDNRNYNREQEVSQCSRAAKLMAKELNVPVILLSQLSRKNEERTDKTPILSDLRESGAIEQDADIVLFVHRPEYYNEKGAETGVGKLVLAKQRDGQTGILSFRHNESLTRFYDYDTANGGAPF